jgi:hypothetical protein
MELKINVIEAAAELAEERVRSYFASELMSVNGINNEEALNSLIYVEIYETTIYTDEAQEVFNAEYDAIFTKLVDCKVTPMPNLFNSKHIFFEDALDKLAHLAVERYFKVEYKDATEEERADLIWQLGELNDIQFTAKAQEVYNEVRKYYESILIDFEI